MPPGMLIFPFDVVFGMLDTTQTKNSPPPGFISGYDREFEEPVTYDADGDGIGELHSVLVEHTLKAQIQSESWKSLNQFASGMSVSGTIELTLWYEDLEDKLLLDSDGWPLIKEGARLLRILSTPTLDFTKHREMYVTEASPESYMFGKPSLYALKVEPREQGS